MSDPATRWEDVVATQTARITELERKIDEERADNASLRCLAIDQQNAITRLLCAIKTARHVKEQLKDENAALRKENRKAHDMACEDAAERYRLNGENAALRADAERYRWIKRDNIGVHDVLELFMSYLNCDLDKEIDAARAKEAQS